MNNKLFILIITVIGILILSFSASSFSKTKQNREEISKLKNVLPLEMLQIIQNPDIVTSRDLRNNGFELVLRKDQVKQLQAFLLKEDSFYYDAKKLAPFIPSTALTFMKKGVNVEIIISLDAKQIEFYYKDFKERLDCTSEIYHLNQILINPCSNNNKK